MTEKKKSKQSKASDIAHVQAALSGDQRAYERLVDKYQRALHFHILKLVRDADVVDDLVQEAFLKAFEGLNTYNRSYAFSTWIYRIATNHSIDYLRKRKLKTFSIDESVAGKKGELSVEFADKEARTDRQIIRKERTSMVRSAIDELPEKYRLVIRMRDMEERSYEEISEALAIPLGTVKAHIFRARELLNKKLKEKIGAY